LKNKRRKKGIQELLCRALFEREDFGEDWNFFEIQLQIPESWMFSALVFFPSIKYVLIY